REEVDEISVVGVNTSTAAGSSGALRLRLRNTGGETLTNANAKLFVNDPISSSDDGAFLGKIKPNETVTALFSVSADASAQAKRYGASVEVSYDD
ncbi:MAG: hypothetical protein SV760_03765, partial [Halobacteria archaeon]|nr:hypothetical protein [Halobacteria archaeon]